MEIIRTSEMAYSSAYGILCQPTLESFFKSGLPFGSKRCVIKPGLASAVHNHHEYECFFITDGTGTLTIGQETSEVKAGDIIRIPAFSDHTLRNTSPSEDLAFLTFWWEDLKALSIKENDTHSWPATLIFSPPPTPNGDLHLGHLSGPYAGADIYKRFLLLKGAKAFHSTWRDDNQSYVPRKAHEQGRSPEALADDYSAQMERTLARSGIQMDHYGHPGHSPYYAMLTEHVVLQLFAEGIVFERESDALFCKATGNYLYEAHVRGGCPHCKAEADGNACEQCGRPNDVIDLIKPQSKYGPEGVETRKVRRLYFKLSAFTEHLRHYHRQTTMPAHLSALSEQMLSAGLPDICISHFTDWGLPVPIKGYENQRLYVWFEMAMGYLAAAQETADKFGLSEQDTPGWKVFYTSEAAEVVHFLGFDNGYFHSILFPAIYIALDCGIRLPSAYVVNELLNLDGLKFSTSRGHLIAGIDLLNMVPSDYVRYYLSYVRPETEKTNFTVSEFVSVIHDELVDSWQVWLNVALKQCRGAFQGKIPAPGAWAKEQRSFFDRITRIYQDAEQAYHTTDFSPQRVCHLANELVREAGRFAASQRYYAGSKTAYDIFRTGMALELLAAKALAVMMQPIMPNFSQSLWRILEDDLPMHWSEVPSFVRDGRMLGQYDQPFFTHVPDTVYTLHRGNNPAVVSLHTRMQAHSGKGGAQIGAF